MGRAAGIVVAAVLVAVGVGTYFVFEQMQKLGEQVTELNDQIVELNEQVSEAETRAEQARERAELAEQQATAAEEVAVESLRRADEAEKTATSSQAQADEAAARAAAAQAEAIASERAREEAEKIAEAAERRRQEAELDIETAREAARLARLEAEAIRNQRERELNRLQSALEKIADTRRTAIGLVMNLSSDAIEFDFDRATLRPENRELLARIAGVLLTAGDYKIQVFGHTDDVGTAEYNQTLSEERATTVRDYLVEAGIEADTITVKGFGKSRPLVEGTDSAARQRNRRVEIAIVQSEIDYLPTPEG